MSADRSDPVPRFAHEAMGTGFEIMIAGHDAEYARQAARAAFAEIDRLESFFSRFDPRSEISRIARLRPGESLRVGVELSECLESALRLGKETDGAFAIDYATLVKYPGGRRSAGDAGRPSTPFRLSRGAGGFAVTIEADALVPLELDLGGVGKGFALDSCREILGDWQVERALLHGGTSTALALGSGPPDAFDQQAGDRGWPVGVAGDLSRPGIPRRLILRDRALSGSGREVKGEHIVDPRSGRPADGHASAWVSCPSAAEADALSTALLVMGSEEAAAFCRSRPEVWALTVSKAGEARVYNTAAAEGRG